MTAGAWSSPRQRVILRLDINEAEAAALRDAAERIPRGETLYSIVCERQRSGIRPANGGKLSWGVPDARVR